MVTKLEGESNFEFLTGNGNIIFKVILKRGL